MKVKVYGLREAQIKQGVEPFDSAEVEVPLGDLTPEQREVLAGGPNIHVVHATAGAVAEWLQAYRDRVLQAEAQEALRDKEYNEQLLAWCQTAKLNERTHVTSGVAYPVWSPEAKPYLYRTVTPETQAVVKATEERLASEAEALNKAALEKAEPAIQEAIARQAKIEGEKQAKIEAAKQAKFAKRLETGVYEVVVTRGDRKEWGEPWIAKLTTRNGRKPEYDFSEGAYNLETETLSIPCKPGETVAYGQKNYRKAKHTEHKILMMRTDGGMNAV